MSIKYNINKKSFETSKLTSYKFLKNEFILYFINVSNDFRLMLYFIDIIYAKVSFNSTVNFVIRLSGKKLSKVLYY
jgi:hypothetical protein